MVLAIPILWENPSCCSLYLFYNKNRYHCINIYLHYVNDGDKTKLLEEYEINFYSWVIEYKYIHDVKESSGFTFIMSLLIEIFIENKADFHTFESREVKKLEGTLSLLKTLNNSNCLNTLKTIIFHDIYSESLNEVFEQLNVLESVHIFQLNYLSFQYKCHEI